MIDSSIYLSNLDLTDLVVWSPVTFPSNQLKALEILWSDLTASSDSTD
jgi:hypothetical protein